MTWGEAEHAAKGRRGRGTLEGRPRRPAVLGGERQAEQQGQTGTG